MVCGALVLAGAFTFGELASRYPQAGGPYVYLREGWGERIAFLYGWQSLLVMDPGVTAALATGLSEYVVLLWPAAAGGERLVAIAVIWILADLSIGRPHAERARTRDHDGPQTARLRGRGRRGVCGRAAAAGRTSSRSSGGRPRPCRLAEAIALGLVSVFFSFGGFWEASRIAGEVRDARRTLPLALAIGVTCVTVVYVATTMAFVYLVPAQQATSASEFARQAGEAMLGPAVRPSSR